jgi:RNA polymerase sigma-70 factor, ECF subfamily
VTPDEERQWTLLMAASQRGDRDAYDTLLRSLRTVVAAYARRRLRSESWSDDVTQDVLLAIHRARHTWNPSRPFAPWFYALLHNRVVDAIRRHKRTVAREDSIDAAPALAFTLTPEATPSVDLTTALAALTPSQRAVIERLKLAEQSVKQVAAELQLSESNVKVIAHRAYTTLRRRLNKERYAK